MSSKFAVLLTLGILALSGCASTQSARDINQMKTEIGMLDQRLSQIERTSLGQTGTAAWPTESQPAEAAVTAASSSEMAAVSSIADTKPSKHNIQQALKNAGLYQGSVDGKIGPQTRSAIREFQRVNGLKVDGVVGKQTWNKLIPYLTMASASSSQSPSPAVETSVSK